MNIFSKFSALALFLASAFVNVGAQEYIVPLGSNAVLQNQSERTVKKKVQDVLVELPFIDDFSYDTPYPSFDLWADDYAYINNGYAIDPPTIGVATLDALDWNGSVYPFATISPATFDADYLTSYPINLNYPAADSIYLSFFYQPQGNGLEPKPYDSLCVDFYDPEAEVWINVWQIPGDTLHSFKQVMIPITENRFLKEGFRFGFRNKASLPLNSEYSDKRGNVDHWNIDYVRLDANRSITDTVIRDVAFIEATPSMLKKYSAIPWDHFKTAYNTIYLPYVRLNYFNNDSAIRNVTRSMSVYDEVWSELYSPGNSSSQDILPGTGLSHDITSIYPFQFSRGDTASFSIKSWLRTDDFDNKRNDTLYKRQVFRDYFSYDDGTAERGYGLRGQGSNNGLIAVRFDSYIADELGGVDIYFTQLKDSLNLGYYFKFMVWNDFDGMPGELIYEGETDYTAVYSDNLNKFVRFPFERTVGVNGKFYVGVLQYNQFLLNIGLDVNTPAGGNLLYSLGGDWLVSSAPGSLMLRPFVQRNYSSVRDKEQQHASLNIRPNPASEYIGVDIPFETDNQEYSLSIFDITGKLVKTFVNYREEIYIGNIEEGLYIVTLSNPKGMIKTGKLLIGR